MKFYNIHGKYKPELDEHFHMYQCQLNFALFLLRVHLVFLGNTSIIQIYLYALLYDSCIFHTRLILHDLGISLPHENGFSKVKNAYIKSAYYSVCDGYGLDADETWMHGDWFYTTGYSIFGHEVKASKRSPPDNLMLWIITQSKGFTRKGIKKI